MKIFVRIIRIIFGLVLLAGFAYGLMSFAKAAPKSGEVKAMIESGTDGSEWAYTAAPAGSQSAQPETQSAQNPEAGTADAPVVEAPPSPTPLPNTPAARAAALGLPAPPDIDITSWEFLLVNGDNSIDQYVPDKLGYLHPNISEVDIWTEPSAFRLNAGVDYRIAQALLDFAVAAKNAGMDVYLSSGYRSYASQQDNFIRICQNNGTSDGKDANGYYITMPAGCSEHQSGLCCDITDKWYGVKTAAELRNKPLSVWMAEHCQDYGFILRFPEGKEDITKVMYEPWHFRYVGVDAAKYIMANGLCFEEFVELYQ